MAVPNYATEWKHRRSTLRQNYSVARLRIRVLIPQLYRQEPIISRLIVNHDLTVNIIGVILKADHQLGQFDLELSGTVGQLQTGLTYLSSLNLVIQGKPNVDGDGWYC